LAAPAAPQAPATPPKTTTDHEGVVGHYGIGFIGLSNLPLADAVPVGRGDQAGVFPNDHLVLQRIPVPTLGLRKWFSPKMAFDAGLGLSITAGDTTAKLGDATATLDKQTVYAFVLHGGLPIVLADTSHMSFFVVPQATLGFATSSVAALYKENGPPPADLYGLRLDAGVRAGAEVYFGFMGLPRLALEAGIGLLFTAEWANATVDNQSVSDTSLGLNNAWFADPWDIFSGSFNTAARYYF
jgi:hypothetical protein